jgi:hypothetical protein
MHTISRKLALALGSSVLLFAASCQQSGQSGSDKTADTAKAAETPAAPAPIELVAVGTSPEFPDAKLDIQSVTAAAQGTDSAKVSFAFNVKNYELKSQTADTGSKLCNNSAQGQHIHFILDNQPYKALYEPKNEVTLANNSEHYLMAFLSRSYHESLKNKGAAVVYHFKIDEKGNLKKLDDPKTPMLFYSRPKGDYMGKDTENVLLDFYVWNANLSADGYKVKADVTNEAIANHTGSFTIDAWKSNFLKNLGMGKTTVTLTLVDKDGKAVEGPMTTASRTITLSEKEPLK